MTCKSEKTYTVCEVTERKKDKFGFMNTTINWIIYDYDVNPVFGSRYSRVIYKETNCKTDARLFILEMLCITKVIW